MSLPTSIHPFLITGNDANQFKVPYSLRFRAGASASLTRTPSSVGNRQKFTLSMWLKRGVLSLNQAIFAASDGTQNNEFLLFFGSGNGDTISVQQTVGGTSSGQISCISSAVFRDPSAWYHIVLSVDTTQATSSNRLFLYVNGVAQTFSTYSVGSSINTWVNNNNPHSISKRADASLYLDGYLSEVNFIDGQQLTPSSFGQTDSLTNQWVPKQYNGTYGTNGFYLPFNDASGATSTTIGKDNSTYRMLTAQMNGTSNGIQRGADLTGVTNGKAGTISMWWNFTGASSGTQILWMSRNNNTIGNTVQVIRYPSGGIGFTAANSSGTWIADFSESSASCAAAGLYHIFVSWDLSVSNKAYIYINGVARTINFSTFTNDTIQYSVPNHGFGGTLYSPFSPTTPGMLGQAYINFSTFIDPTTSISYFYGGTATPVSLGASGQLPTGSSPIVYLDGDATSILTNRGTGGNFSAYGTLATGTTYTGVGKNINDWTPSGISVTSGVTYDVMRDSPTAYDDGSNIYNRGNYPTLRILRPAVAGHTYSNGNLRFSSNNTGSYTILADGRFPSTGKYYFEIKFSTINVAGYYIIVGVGNKSYTSDGVTGGASWNTTNTIGVAVDCDNSTFQGYKDGVAQTLQTGATVQDSEPYFSIIGSTSTNAFDVNFGQRPFSYTPPAGFLALNTYNLPNPSLPLV